MEILRVVLSVGGSLLFRDKSIDTKYIKHLCGTLDTLPLRYGIVVGGGTPARMYANAVRNLVKGRLYPDEECYADEIAVHLTRANAMLFGAYLGARVYRYFEEIPPKTNERFIIMGGTVPGITTDTDAVILAEKLGAERIVNLSDIDGVYDKNPALKDAKKIKKLSHEKLLSLALKYDTRKAGGHFIFDSVACKLLMRSKREVHFVDGREIDDVVNALLGKEHNGSLVSSER